MSKREARRINRNCTEAERLRWEAAVDETMRKLPELIKQGEQQRVAAAEDTLSGQLRNTVHTSEMPLREIAVRLTISEEELVQFLTCERPFSSDVLDRLSQLLGHELVRSV